MPVLSGKAWWPSVTKPNTTYEPQYSVNLIVEEDVAKDFKKRGFTVKDMDDGPAIIIRRKVNGPNGMIRNAPKLLDRNKNPLDCQIGNGSDVKVQYKEWEKEVNGQLFKGLDFLAMQVINLINYGEPGDEFDVEDDLEDEL
jgi:hypothetical protein